MPKNENDPPEEEGETSVDAKKEDAVDPAAEGETRTEDAAARDRLLKTVRRIAKVTRGLFAAHVIVVRKEVDREILRVLIGLVFLAGSGMFFLSSSILLSVTVVAGIQRATGLPMLESLALCLSFTMSVALFCALVAFLRLRKPLMPESRELLQKTLDGVTGK